MLHDWLVAYMCACLYRLGMSGHHQMHFIDVPIININMNCTYVYRRGFKQEATVIHCITNEMSSTLLLVKY